LPLPELEATGGELAALGYMGSNLGVVRTL
jgi:hypothetical protein